MEKLAPELYAEIVECIRRSHRATNVKPKAKLASYAAISRRWKESIERYTFKEIDGLKTTELETFQQLFLGTNIRRREYLKQLTVHFILPDPPDMDACCDMRVVIDRDADSKAFTASIRELFDTLSDLERRSSKKPNISLIFDRAYRRSPGTFQFGGSMWYNCYGHNSIDIREARASSGKFELLAGDPLPDLHHVTQFKFQCGNLLADLKPTWIPVITCHLPQMTNIKIREKDLYEFGRKLRKIYRNDLARSLCLLPASQLTEIVLDITHTELPNDDVLVHKLVNPGNWIGEAWSVVFCRLAQFPHLVTLHLLGGLTICPEFFRSIEQLADTAFQSLQELVVEFAPETADGRWFYKRDEDAFAKAKVDPELSEFWEDLEEFKEDCLETADYLVFRDSARYTCKTYPNRFRSVPDPQVFAPFLQNATHVVGRLPQLRKFVLGGAHLSGSSLDYPFVSRKFELCWLRSGEPRSPSRAKTTAMYRLPYIKSEADYIDQNRLYWRTGNWVPWEEVQSAWTKAAGANAKIVFLDEKHWSGNPRRAQPPYYYRQF